MKKIFVYVGSQGGEDSNTVKFIKLILNKVIVNQKDQIKYDIYTPKDIFINRCVGCINCFANGICIYDDKDDMKLMKEKMVEADFHIWGSPVYAANVSGDMKIFIDRISYWTHLMRCYGKPALAVTTSCGNGAEHTLDYMYRIMSFMGLKVLRKINGLVFNPSQINDDFMKNEIEYCAELINTCFAADFNIESDETLETIFRSVKKNALSYANNPIYEYYYWQENGFFELNSFQQLLLLDKERV